MVSIPAMLTIIEGEGKDQRFILEETPFTIGRAPECSMTLTAIGVSRLHARIDSAYGQYTITDMSSTNGTFVNDQRVEGAVPLHHGDRVRFASAIETLFEDPSATAQIDVGQLSLGGLRIDETRKEVFVDGHLVDPSLSPQQYALLEVLVHHEGQIVTRDEIAEVVWPDQVGVSDQMIDTLVSRLRSRLSEYSPDDFIVTRRGFGLMFTQG